MGASSAKRRPTRRTRAWSAWMDGSSIRCSSAAYSSRRLLRRSLLTGLSLGRTCRHANGARPRDGERAPLKQLLLLRGVDLGVLRLELRDPARGVEDALLAGVERVAGAAGLDADLAALGGAAGGEGAAAGADDLGGRVLRVNAALHVFSVPLEKWSPGRITAGTGTFWPMYQSAMPPRPGEIGVTCAVTRAASEAFPGCFALFDRSRSGWATE